MGNIALLTHDAFAGLAEVWGLQHTPPSAELMEAQWLRGDREIWVFAQGRNLLGEGSLLFETGDPEYTWPETRVHLSRLVVRERYRGRGIGAALLAHLCKRARELGYEEMSARADINNVGWRWLLEKNGFCQILFAGEDSKGRFVKLLKKLV